MPKYAARTDSNHSQITSALRRAGCTVRDTSRLGNGFPDILVKRGSLLTLMEIKRDDKAKMTDAEYKFALEFEGHVHIVTTVDEAYKACGLLSAKNYKEGKSGH